MRLNLHPFAVPVIKYLAIIFVDRATGIGIGIDRQRERRIGLLACKLLDRSRHRRGETRPEFGYRLCPSSFVDRH